MWGDGCPNHWLEQILDCKTREKNVQNIFQKALTRPCCFAIVVAHTVKHKLQNMRTKALLSVAAIAASAISAMAQTSVYSLNIVGYAKIGRASCRERV